MFCDRIGRMVEGYYIGEEVPDSGMKSLGSLDPFFDK